METLPKVLTNKQLGGTIRDLRRRKGMSESRLAKLLNVPEHLIAYIELGLRAPSANLIRRLEKILEFDFDFLEGYAREPETKKSRKR